MPLSSSRPQQLQELARRIAGRRVLFVLGSGVNGFLTSWDHSITNNDLMLGMESHGFGSWSLQYPQLKPTQSQEYGFIKVGLRDVQVWLKRKQSSVRIAQTGFIHELSRFQVPIVSTNFDTVIAQAAGRTVLPLNFQRPDSRQANLHELVIHPYGSWFDVESIIDSHYYSIHPFERYGTYEADMGFSPAEPYLAPPGSVGVQLGSGTHYLPPPQGYVSSRAHQATKELLEQVVTDDVSLVFVGGGRTWTDVNFQHFLSMATQHAAGKPHYILAMDREASPYQRFLKGHEEFEVLQYSHLDDLSDFIGNVGSAPTITPTPESEVFSIDLSDDAEDLSDDADSLPLDLRRMGPLPLESADPDDQDNLSGLMNAAIDVSRASDSSAQFHVPVDWEDAYYESTEIPAAEPAIGSNQDEETESSEAFMRPVLWIAGTDDIRPVLSLGEPYDLLIKMSDRQLASLVAFGEGEIDTANIAPEGLETDWVVSSQTFRFEESNTQVAIQEYPLRQGTRYSASFGLRVPKSGESEVRSIRLIPLSSTDASVSVLIFAICPLPSGYSRRELIREFDVELDVEEPHVNP